jgi:multidrug resistance efflux pump
MTSSNPSAPSPVRPGTPPERLSALLRHPEAGAAPAVPAPPFRWGTRVAIPGAIVFGMGLMMLLATGGALVPAIDVRAVPVVERSIAVAPAARQASIAVAPADADGTPSGPGAQQRRGADDLAAATSPGGGFSRFATSDGRRSGAPRSSDLPAGAEPVAQAAGWIEADPFLTYATSLAEGVVEEVFALEGEPVTRGETIARLVPDDALLALDRARAEAAIHEAHIAEASAAVEAAQLAWDEPYRQEAAVATSEARLAESEALLSQLGSELQAGEAMLERLMADFDRIAPLADSGAAPSSDKIDARTMVQEQEAKVEALRRRLEVTEAQGARAAAELRAAREDRRLRIDERRALDSARASLARARAEHAGALARLREAELRVARLDVKAPISGIVVERFKEPGAKIMLGMDDPRSASIVSIYDPAKLQVRVDVPLPDAGRLAIGQRAAIVAESLPHTTFVGHVTRILHRADIAKNTLQAKVAIEAPSSLLRPEMLARITFYDVMMTSPAEPGDGSAVLPTAATGGAAPPASVRTSLWVPDEALMNDTLWVVSQFDGEEGIAERRVVAPSLSPAESGWRAIAEGLNAGDLVIVAPPASLSPGARVRVSAFGTSTAAGAPE